jgi:hypothetical protein
MGVNYSPSIVKDAIVFNVDAANLKCYDPRENLTIYSQGAFNNVTYWPKVSSTGYTITDNTTETAAPDGTFTASKILCTAPAVDGSSSFYQDITMPYGLGTYTTSIYFKSSNASRIRIQMFGLWNTIDGFSSIDINPTTGANIASNGTLVVEDVGNGWRRYSITKNANNVNNTVLKFQIYLDNSAGTTYIWGGQIERKSSPGPYVATTTSAVVKPLPCNNMSVIPALESVNNNNRTMYDHRNAGSFTFDGGANFERSSTTYNFPGGGSVDVWFRLGVIGTQQGIFYIGDGGTNVIDFWYNNSTLRWETARAGVGASVVSTTVLAANTWYHAVGTWDSSSIYLYLNGSLQASLATANRPNAITGGMAIGTYLSGMTGNISAVKVYNRTLSAAEVATNFNALRSRYSL